MCLCNRSSHLQLTGALCGSQQAEVSCRKLHCIRNLEYQKDCFCSRSSYLQLLGALCSSQQATGSVIVWWTSKTQKNVFVVVPTAWSLLEPRAACNKLQWAARTWIASWVWKAKKCVFAAVLATCNSLCGLEQAVVNCRKLHCVMRFQNPKNVFLQSFPIFAVYWSLVQPATSCSELPEAALCHELRKLKRVFWQLFQQPAAYWSPLQPVTSYRAARSWIAL